MSRTASPPARDFGAPFDFTDADICLRSVDGYHFRAHKAILAVASATLRDFGFESPAGGRDTRNGLTVIPFVAAGEEESVVANFLRLIYPGETPIFARPDDVRLLFELCKKYQADGLLGRLEQLLIASAALKTHPITLYALACIHRLEPLARAAASESMRHPDILEGSGYEDAIAMMRSIDL
jgi:hypothetical protein